MLYQAQLTRLISNITKSIITKNPLLQKIHYNKKSIIKKKKTRTVRVTLAMHLCVHKF